MTPSTVRLKQLAEDCLPEDLIDVQGAYRRFNSAANPQAILELIARIEKLEAALELSRSDVCWILDRHDVPLLNDVLGTICEALKEET